MKPWQILGRERAPEGGELVLYHSDGNYVIRVDGKELMSSRAHDSEEVLAQLGCRHLQSAKSPRVLIGGLGLGYTLRAALAVLPKDASVTVAEIVPAVVTWNRGPLADLAGRPLEDPRVIVEPRDVGLVLRTTRVRFDAILLDIDNGPAGLTRKGNQVLYADRHHAGQRCPAHRRRAGRVVGGAGCQLRAPTAPRRPYRGDPPHPRPRQERRQ